MESETTKPDFVCDRLYDKLVGLGSKTSAAIHNWRFKQAQRSLEHDLASIIETANSHRAKGLSNGSPAYVALREKAASMTWMDAIQVNLLSAGHSGPTGGSGQREAKVGFRRSAPTDQFSTNRVGRQSDRLEYVLRRRAERGH